MENKRGFRLDNNQVFEHPVIGIIDVGTGYSGEGWTSLAVLHSGTFSDDLGWEHAVSNAQSYGYESCDCGEEGCDFCSEDRNTMENVYGTFYKYWPSKSGGYVNGGDPQSEVIEACIKYEGIRIADLNKEAVLYVGQLAKLLYMPESTREEDLAYLIDGLRSYSRKGYKIVICP